MSDVDLSPIGAQLGPIIFKIIIFLISVALILTVIFSYIVNRILKKYFEKMKPFLRISVSVLLGVIVAFTALILIVKL